jgi:hypothetical protein
VVQAVAVELVAPAVVQELELPLLFKDSMVDQVPMQLVQAVAVVLVQSVLMGLELQLRLVLMVVLVLPHLLPELQ